MVSFRRVKGYIKSLYIIKIVDMSKKQELSVEIKEEKEMSSANWFHEKLCKAFILMSIVGGVSAYIGYVLAPESCASGDDTIFETIGVALFAISFYCFPISPIFWLVSLFRSDMDSGHVFFWSLLTGVIIIISTVIFIDYVLQDMFCGCWGFPGEDCS